MGYQYLFEWSDHSDPEKDVVVQDDDAAVVVDMKSRALIGSVLKGLTLDFETGMLGHGFRFVETFSDIKKCGCGHSFGL